jgi:NDP-sugar pyrophosphorylase family protein
VTSDSLPSASRITQAVILAAGRGARMGPLTDMVPKPMAPYAGSTLIAHAIQQVMASVPRIHITVGYKKAMLAQHVLENGVASVINTEGQTNAWWIHHSLLRYVDEPIYVLTCDNITAMDFAAIEASYFALGAPACMLIPVTPVPGLDGDYIFHDADYVVTAVDRHRPAPIYASGVQVLNPARVGALTRDGGDFYSIWSQLIAKRLLLVSPVRPTKWFTVDTAEQLAHVNSAID